MVYILVVFFEASTLFYMYALKLLEPPYVTMDAWASILIIHQHHSSLDRASESDLHKRSWPASQPANIQLISISVILILIQLNPVSIIVIGRI